MAIYDMWHADNEYSAQGEEIGRDVADWPNPTIEMGKKRFTLRLEELTHFDIFARIEARERNLIRINAAQKRNDIAHLEVHYSCCVDKIQRDALEALVLCDQREWLSFTLQGVSGMNDFYSKPVSLEGLSSLFLALRTIKVLNLHSCTLYRGHGLESILKTIPFLSQLEELRLQGWQMDRVSVQSLLASLKEHKTNSVTLLSLRSCYFLGTETFTDLTEGLSSTEQLRTLNLSYCNLSDVDIIPLVQTMKAHPSIECLHIGGNDCVSSESVDVIAGWVNDSTCKLRDLNLRALWIGFSEDGLLERRVNLSSLYESLSQNDSLESFTLSENYLESQDMLHLTRAFQNNKCAITHLDLGDNPFDETGAKALLRFVNACSSLESIRFENHFVAYSCAAAIKTYTRFNYFDRRLAISPLDLPMSIWPTALARVQAEGNADERMNYSEGSKDVIFRLLRSTTGEIGLPLSFRIATHR